MKTLPPPELHYTATASEKVPGYSRGVHGRDEVECDVTTARRLECDERLHVLEEVDLVVQSLARLSVDRQVQRSVRRELAATTNNALALVSSYH